MDKLRLKQMLGVDDRRPGPLLGIFVKEPVAGQVKTRLCPPLLPAEAADLYTVAMRETIERFRRGPAHPVLFHAGGEDYFRRQYSDLPRVPQVGEDLGARMTNALELLLATGAEAAALIGSDSPDLPLAQVVDAFTALARHTAVTIPATDGGYVLVGLSAPCPELFRDIPWSSSEVLEASRRRAAEFGLDYHETGGWQDIDDAASLQVLLRRSPGSATAQYLRERFADRFAPPGKR